MRKNLLLIFLLVIKLSFAAEIPLEKAQTVAFNFLQSTQQFTLNRTPVNSINLLFTEQVNNNGNIESAYYIFAGENNKGFVIVSGDDAVIPILGYSDESPIDMNNLPPSFKMWMENNKNQILNVKANHLQATSEIITAWDNFYNNNIPANNSRSTTAVNPLCATTWDQQPYYNALCPYDAANTTNQHAVTGCPATAMAQIMKYWNYPAQGSGIHSYNHPTYGTLSANFGSTTYNWGAMPNNVTSTNNEVAKLMYQCGVSVNMQYGANSSGGFVIINSPTPQANCEYAYKTYFGYDPSTIHGLERTNYTDANWITLLKNELNASRPIQYAGFGSGGGHTFVCDGYDASDNFHMNWGWSGYYDGYFAISALNPGGLGTGGGTGGYNGTQQAVIGIKPAVSSNSNLALYSSITVNPNPIPFAQAFTVNADIVNNGAGAFVGDYTAALFNSSGVFVDYIQTYTGNTLPAGNHYTGGITFSTTGIIAIPGTYYIGIFYKEGAGNWNLVSAGSYTNLISVTISGPVDYIKLNSNITPSPATFVQGQSASVNVNILNDGTATYYGVYEAALYDLSGNFVQSIGSLSETNGLPVGYTYNSPYLTFSSASITATPGTYILAILETETGMSQYLCGGDLYTNPVYIKVVAAPLLPDIYESNNSQATAYTLPLTFSGNTATKNTSGSNNHTGSDYDFYKINLATGYNYQITARVQDSYSSNNGITYTNDVVLSYYNGGVWSSAYDDVLPSAISATGGSSVIFQVAPYFAGNTGTYRLDISVVRTATAGIDEFSLNNTMVIYPNPAKDALSFKLNQDNCKIHQINIYDNIGKLVKSLPEFSQNLIEVSDLSEGFYFITIETDKGNFKSKFNVVK